MGTSIAILIGLFLAGILAEYFVRKKISRKDAFFKEKLLTQYAPYFEKNLVFRLRTDLWSEKRKGNLYLTPGEMILEYRPANRFSAFIGDRMPSFQAISKKPYEEIEKGVFGFTIKFVAMTVNTNEMLVDGIIYDESIFFKAGITAETKVTIAIGPLDDPSQTIAQLKKYNLS